MYRELVEMIYAPDVDVVTATHTFAEGASAILEATDYQDACPIATVALEIASTNEPMRVAAAAAFDSWLVVLEQRLVEAGVTKPRAEEMAVELFCIFEGAFLLSRTKRDTTPMAIAGRAAAAIVAAAIRPQP